VTWLSIVICTGVVVALGALIYWQFVIAEGTYLGSRMVAWTYDWVAMRYDAIKQFNPRNESWFIAMPVLRGLQGLQQPLLLDVATGTGRLPLALLQERFRGQIVGLDLSQGMLRQARAKLRMYGEQVTLVRQDASELPFDDEQFDAVTCLESLEFMPRPLEVLAEMVRVLAPGGILFLTNRVGKEARLLPRRALSRPLFERTLAAFPLTEVKVYPWQVDYDLAIARKLGWKASSSAGGIGGEGAPAKMPDLCPKTQATDAVSSLRCPQCAGPLQRGVGSLLCPGCERPFPIRDGVVHLAGQGG
jgi:ubiquinone/menaquinone biosynthesis C-methylase UbiE